MRTMCPRRRPDAAETHELQRPLHRVIKKVGDDIERLAFNTAISAMMEFNNILAKAPVVPLGVALVFVRLLEPFAPHFAEEVHARLIKDTGMATHHSVSLLPWPTFDPAMLVDSTLDLPVQVNGKVRGRVQVAADAEDSAVFAAALADAEVQKFLEGKPVKKKIYIKGRMVNLVV